MVTLAGLLGWQGVLIYVFDVDKGAVGGVISLPSGVIADLVSGSMTPVAGWIVLVVGIGLFALATILTTGRRRSQGLSAPPLGITLATIGAVAVAGIVLVCDLQPEPGCADPGEGRALGHPVPRHRSSSSSRSSWHGPGWGATSTPSAPVPRRPAAPASTWPGCGRSPSHCAASSSGLAVVVYASRLGSLSVGFDGGTYVLYAIAAAVIGGASLFGGYGKPIHPLLGGLVIATLTNGLALLNISTAGTDIATAAVLLVAVAVDATLRRRGEGRPEARGRSTPRRHGRAQRAESTDLEHRAHPGHDQRDRHNDGHHLHQRPVHRLPVADVGELVEHGAVGVGPRRFLGRPVVERSRLPRRDVAEERAQALGEVGLGRYRERGPASASRLALRLTPREPTVYPLGPWTSPSRSASPRPSRPPASPTSPSRRRVRPT